MPQGGTYTGNAIEYETCVLNATVCGLLSGTWTAASSTCTVASATIPISFDLTIPTETTLLIAAGATVSNLADLVNEGTILVEGAFWAAYSTGTFTRSGILTNDGTVHAEGGAVTNTGTPGQETAELWISGAFSNSGVLTNHWTVYLAGGTFTNSGTVNNGAAGQTDSQFLIQSGTFNNTASGEFQNYAWLVNQGTLSKSGTIHHRFYLENRGTIANSGTIYSYCGAMVTGSGTVSGTPIEYEICLLNETVCGWLSGTCTIAAGTTTPRRRTTVALTRSPTRPTTGHWTAMWRQ